MLPLHGLVRELTTIDDAVAFIMSYNDQHGSGAVHRYEILIRYNNGDKIEATFKDKDQAIQHLRSYQPLPGQSQAGHFES